MRPLIGYFRSVAMAIEIQANTRAEWKSYEDSTVLNVAYALMPWKEKPGTVEVHQNWRAIDQRTQERTAQMLETFFTKLRSGPGTAATYAHQLQSTRQYALKSVAELFADVHQINSEVAGQAAQGARNMALIQFGCTMALAITGCGLALGASVPAVMTTSGMGLKAAGVGLGYNIAGAIIKDSMSLGSAQAIAIEGSKTVSGEALGHYGGNAQTKLAAQIADKSQQISATERNIAALNAEIARKTSAKKIAKLQASVAAKREGIRRAEEATAKAALKKGAVVAVGKAIPLVFLAHDVINAWGDLSGTWEATR